jgi:hypothetical protein
MRIKKGVHFAGLCCLLGLSLVSFNSCHLVKRTINERRSMSNDENLVRRVIETQVDWNFAELRLSGKAEEDKNRIAFMGIVKLEKDKQIFMIVRSAIGIELARVYANRDSVWLVSKMLNLKEKVDWKLAGGKVGYPVDFYVIQGILMQSLFSSSGTELKNLLENLIVKKDKEYLRLLSNTNLNLKEMGVKYFNDFLISQQLFLIDGVKIRDINGQWIADVKYSYNKENEIKRIELKGIDSERNFALEMNIVKRDFRDFIEINFDKF